MTQDDSDRPWGVTIAALALACVVLGGFNVWRWLDARGRAVESSGMEETDAPAVPVPTRAAPVTVAPGGSETGSAARRTEPVGEDRPGMVVGEGLAPGGSAGAGDAPLLVVESSSGAEAATATAPGLPRPVPGGTGAPQDIPRGEAAAATTGESAPAAIPPKDSLEDEPPAGSDGSSDRTPPVLGHLRFDPGLVEGGSATTLTIQANDAMSGVKSVRGEIQSPSGKANLPLRPQDSQDGRSFTYVVKIPPSAESGVWFVKWLSLTDMANNSSLTQAASATMAPPGGTFSVSSGDSDSIPPDVVSISFEKDVIENEDRNVIRVEVKDDLSGVSSVSGVCRSPSGSARIPFACALNPESGRWEGTISIPQSADCGEWSVQQLSAKDKAGNTAFLTAEARNLGHAGFRVDSGTDCDSSAPTLEGLVLSRTVVSNETENEIVISAVVRDVGSGAASLTGWFEGPVSEGGQVTRSNFTCAPDPGNAEAPWTGRILIPRFSPKGTWKVRAIELKDRAQNVREYAQGDAAIAAGAFEVQ